MRDWMNLFEAAPKKRRGARYVIVYSNVYVMLELPDQFISQRILSRAIIRLMKQEFGIKAKDLHGSEGVAGMPEDQAHEEDHGYLKKVEAAFAGSKDFLKPFHLFKWNGESFEKVRDPVTSS